MGWRVDKPTKIRAACEFSFVQLFTILRKIQESGRLLAERLICTGVSWGHASRGPERPWRLTRIGYLGGRRRIAAVEQKMMNSVFSEAPSVFVCRL